MSSFQPLDLSGARLLAQPPAGTYAVRIVEVEPTISSQKGTPGLRVAFEILSGPGASGEYNGQRIRQTIWYGSDYGRDQLKTILLVSGGTEEELKSFVPEMLIGRTLTVEMRPNDRGYLEGRGFRKLEGVGGQAQAQVQAQAAPSMITPVQAQPQAAQGTGNGVPGFVQTQAAPQFPAPPVPPQQG